MTHESVFSRIYIMNNGIKGGGGEIFKIFKKIVFKKVLKEL